jgi:hypothetical protein
MISISCKVLVFNTNGSKMNIILITEKIKVLKKGPNQLNNEPLVKIVIKLNHLKLKY